MNQMVLCHYDVNCCYAIHGTPMRRQLNYQNDVQARPCSSKMNTLAVKVKYNYIRSCIGYIPLNLPHFQRTYNITNF